jgi:hypothetical protein
VAFCATTLVAVALFSASTSGMEIDTSHGAFTMGHHHHWHASDSAGDGKDVRRDRVQSGPDVHIVTVSIFGIGNSMHRC